MSSRPERIVLAVLSITLLTFVVCSARAQAAVEFCPATVLGFHAIVDPGTAPAATVYGYKIGALGKRTTSGTVAIETDKGWYTVPFPKTMLYDSTRAYGAGANAYDVTTFTAPTRFVRFAQPVVVRRMWVAQAVATGDGDFGWQARGSVPCEPALAVVPPAFEDLWNVPDENEHPPTTFRSPFAVPSVATPATPVDAPLGANCASPFVRPALVTAAKPAWPDSLGVTLKVPASSAILAIALDGKGNIEDIWPWLPSPYEELNAAEIAAAKKSTFAPGIALCRPVPSMLFYRYDWSHA